MKRKKNAEIDRDGKQQRMRENGKQAVSTLKTINDVLMHNAK